MSQHTTARSTRATRRDRASTPTPTAQQSSSNVQQPSDPEQGSEGDPSSPTMRAPSPGASVVGEHTGPAVRSTTAASLNDSVDAPLNNAAVNTANIDLQLMIQSAVERALSGLRLDGQILNSHFASHSEDREGYESSTPSLDAFPRNGRPPYPSRSPDSPLLRMTSELSRADELVPPDRQDRAEQVRFATSTAPSSPGQHIPWAQRDPSLNRDRPPHLSRSPPAPAPDKAPVLSTGPPFASESIPTRLSPLSSGYTRESTEASSRLRRQHDQARSHLDLLITENIDVPPDDRGVADVLRKAKLPLPDPYSGKPSVEVFQKWITDFVVWCGNMNIVGPELDRKRVQLLGSNLSDQAATWYYTEVLSPSRETRHWTFRSLVHALHERFVPRSTMIQAIEDFDRCRYSSDDGARGFWSRLRVVAVRLPAEPDPYSLARRFLLGLPKEIFDIITINRGLSAEYSPVTELIEAAEEAENSLRIVRNRDSQVRRTPGMNPNTTESRARDSRPARDGTRPPIRNQRNRQPFNRQPPNNPRLSTLR